MHDLPLPGFAWTGVLTINVAETLPEFVAYASSCGVKKLHFNEVGIFDGAVARGLNIVDQEGEVFERAASQVEQAVRLAARCGIAMDMAEMPRIKAKREAVRHGKSFGLPLIRHSTPTGDCYIHNEVAILPEGYTRDCASPGKNLIGPKGQVFACCTRGEVMGIAKTKAEIEDVLKNEKYQKLRHSLRTGVDLDSACANCLIRPAVPVEKPELRSAEKPAGGSG